MDPLTAIGLASNTISFIDFSWELITGAQALETIIADLEEVLQHLTFDVKGTSQNEIAVLQLAEEFWRVSRPLSRIPRELKANINKKSSGKVLKSNGLVCAK
ncbi:hypothetical protein BGW36DRAFT_362519 [Talaromyces proteolyticus]|uniref:Uncharacterized protein n=1 Tax=Talaromyces proteolyticus TaxID=1131652 RepID=A0AAD4KI45_9EURO|nr:uncharacterized protein BGW36DRAFT_362519 [Talaromyces proteolyticus]KAH8692977.1 hypothetical protein BGW36DRAFT_362519 [Talaromyces proteolyticus]